MNISAPAAAHSIPAAAGWMTGLGIIPFAGLAAGHLAMPAKVGEPAVFAVLAYGAVILSFLGGIRWGLAIAPGHHLNTGALWYPLALSVVPALTAWLALLAPAAASPIILAAAFLLMLASDWQVAQTGVAPPWFMRLRWPPTAAAVLSLLAVGLL